MKEKKTLKALFNIMGRPTHMKQALVFSLSASVLYCTAYIVISVMISFYKPSSKEFAFLALAVLTFAALYIVFSTLARRDSALVTAEMVSELRIRLVNHMRKLPMSFYRERDAGKISAYLLQSMTNIEKIFAQFFTEFVTLVVSPVIFVVCYFYLSVAI